MTLGGAKGSLRIYDADTISPGFLYGNLLYTSFVTKTEDGAHFIGDHTLNASATLGLSRAFELFLHTVPYQDDQVNAWGPIGNSRAGIKFHVPKRGPGFHFGLVGFVSLPTGLNQNVPYESFSVDAYGWGLLAAGTIDFRNISGTLPLKVSFNLGIRDHDWSDRYFVDGKDQLIGGVGLKFPIRSSLLYSEVSGEVFMNREDIGFKQNFLRFTQGIKFFGPFNLVCDLGADIELGRYQPTSANPLQMSFIKDYADWKIIFGVTHRWHLFNRPDRQEQQKRQRENQERDDLDTIRQKREQAAKEIEEMSKQLQKEKKREPIN